MWKRKAREKKENNGCRTESNINPESRLKRVIAICETINYVENLQRLKHELLGVGNMGLAQIAPPMRLLAAPLF